MKTLAVPENCFLTTTPLVIPNEDVEIKRQKREDFSFFLPVLYLNVVQNAPSIKQTYITNLLRMTSFKLINDVSLRKENKNHKYVAARQYRVNLDTIL